MCPHKARQPAPSRPIARTVAIITATKGTRAEAVEGAREDAVDEEDGVAVVDEAMLGSLLRLVPTTISQATDIL